MSKRQNWKIEIGQLDKLDSWTKMKIGQNCRSEGWTKLKSWTNWTKLKVGKIKKIGQI